MNGTWKNYAKHAGLGVAIALLFGALFGAGAGFWIGLVWFWAKEAGEFSVKHWDAPGRPLADLNPFHELRTPDDRLDLLSGAAGAVIGGVLAAVLS
jgi:hypothetical protein